MPECCSFFISYITNDDVELLSLLVDLVSRPSPTHCSHHISHASTWVPRLRLILWSCPFSPFLNMWTCFPRPLPITKSQLHVNSFYAACLYCIFLSQLFLNVCIVTILLITYCINVQSMLAFKACVALGNEIFILFNVVFPYDDTLIWTMYFQFCISFWWYILQCNWIYSVL